MNNKKIIISIISILIIIAILSLSIGRGIIQGKQPTLTSFSIINFSGYLFFIILPVEALIPYYLSLGYSGLLIALLAIITGIIAQMLDYSVGYSVSENVIHDFIGKWRYQKVEKIIQKYGDRAIFLFSLFPISSPIIVLAAGVLRYDFKKVVLYSFLGLVIKYFLVVFFIKQFIL